MDSQTCCLQGTGGSAEAGPEPYSSLHPTEPVTELVFSKNLVKGMDGGMDGWMGGWMDGWRDR